MQDKTRTWFVRHRLKIAALFVLGLTFLTIINSGSIYKQLDDWRLIPRPERVTELYLENHALLPSEYTLGEKHVVSFVISNLEYSTTEYRYKIIEIDESGTNNKILYEGHSEVGHDNKLTVNEEVSLIDMGERIKIQVEIEYKAIKFGEDELSDQYQSVYYWLKRKASNE